VGLRVDLIWIPRCLILQSILRSCWVPRWDPHFSIPLPPFTTIFIGLNILETTIPQSDLVQIDQQVQTQWGEALIKLKKKKSPLRKVWPSFAAWRTSLEQPCCRLTSLRARQLPPSWWDLHEVSWNYHLENWTRACLGEPVQRLAWGLPQLLSQTTPLCVSQAGHVLQGSCKQGTVPLCLTVSGFWLQSVLALLQEMTNQKVSQKPDLWEKRIVSVSGSSFISF